MEIGCELDNGWGYITNYNNANGIYVYSGVAGDDVVFDAGGAFAIKPYGDEEADLGTGSYRYDDVYATNGTIEESKKIWRYWIIVSHSQSGIALPRLY